MTDKLYGLSSNKFKDLALQYSKDKTSVDKVWQDFFASFDISDILQEKKVESKQEQAPKQVVKHKQFNNYLVENISSLSTAEQSFISNFNQNFIAENLSMVKALGYTRKASFLEEFLAKKFIGVKRFSIEGLESAILMLQELKTLALADEVENINLAMSHRGRLNVLANFLEKPYAKIISGFLGFDEFGGVIEGDVKYHLGYKKTIVEGNKKLELNLHNNPSHLEAAN